MCPPLHEKVFLVGPGGVGKTTVGPLLASRLHATFVDLDEQFCDRISPIRRFLDEHGYNDYILANAALFRILLEESKSQPRTIFALSSGFLVTDVEAETIAKNRTLIMEQGTVVLLLPSKDVADCIRIIVERQLRRGLGLERKFQMALVLQRLQPYSVLGHIQVWNSGPPESIAEQAKLQLEALWSSSVGGPDERIRFKEHAFL